MKKIIFLAIISLFQWAFGQQQIDPQIQWQNSIGGNGMDQLSVINQTSDGGYICGGYSESDSSGDKTSINQDGDFWVIKLDNIGNIQWQNTFDGDIGSDILSSIEQTKDGNYICGGYKVMDINGNLDFWIIKLDTVGNIIWEKLLVVIVGTF